MVERSNSADSPERTDTGVLFELGRLVATPGAIQACQEAHVSPLVYIDRHAKGDWGDLDEEDHQANELAIETGARLLSAYSLPTAERLWVITEADRSATTALLPSEY